MGRACCYSNVAVQGLVQALSVDILVGRGRQAVHQACIASDYIGPDARSIIPATEVQPYHA
jgi:hypothetical protein